MNEKIKESNIAMIYFAYQEFSQHIDLERFKINKTQHRILFLVSHLTDPSIKKVLGIMRISKQGFNKAYKDLEERHLLGTKPSAADPRAKDLFLTKEGEAMITELNHDQSEKINRLLELHNGNWHDALNDMVEQYLQSF
ncbi:MarR family winged helix-turn-helix transcriptional regulator [Fructobacillus durionis]|uniref:DNA-binding transcriptional regulator, MarR family n=1 Tax=Fructobacillus durionis TaxID=283737 RepID=A0A1I1EI42_9LACO|nr:MarR family winged helix-turn-helix transcriptional regulator [Fructobacillus durionis]SFB86824.1 DNA-binding transcriptional regulator, MarR family [Fructobacillus durionis]